MTPERLGARASAAVLAVGILYAATLGAGFARHGLTEPITDPVLVVMEVLTVLSALPILALFVALHAVASERARPWATLALCFAAMFALATMGVHVVELTVGRQTGQAGLVWPSVPYAIELLAWDVLLGLALLLGAPVLDWGRAAERTRRGVQVTGVLCLAGMIGPAVGNMRWQLMGVFGYAVLLPLVAWGLARWFRENVRAAA